MSRNRTDGLKNAKRVNLQSCALPTELSRHRCRLGCPQQYNLSPGLTLPLPVFTVRSKRIEIQASKHILSDQSSRLSVNMQYIANTKVRAQKDLPLNNLLNHQNNVARLPTA